MSASISKEVAVMMDLSASELAKLVGDLDEREQAEFFVALDRVFAAWGGGPAVYQRDRVGFALTGERDAIAFLRGIIDAAVSP